MKASLTERLKGTDGAWKEPGTVIDHPDAWKLVRNGCAIPADAECEARCEGIDTADAAARYKAVSLGIHPDDLTAFRNGEMIGYDDAGEWIPGPNYRDPDEQYDEVENAFADMIADRVAKKMEGEHE